MSPFEQRVSLALRNPRAAIRELDRLEAEDSLVSFIRQYWSILEPGRPFVHGWHVDAIAAHLSYVSDGEFNRLLINVPPGFMKSLMVNVFWPAWEWGPRNKPWTRLVKGSYSSALTIRDNRRMRRLIQSEDYQKTWGDRVELTGDENNKVKFENTATGWSLATSVGGIGTGERGDRVLVDDPHNVLDGESEAVRSSAVQWFNEVLPTRMVDPEKSSIVVIMQRVHEKDVSGNILARDLGYEHLMLPMEFEPKRVSYTKVPTARKPSTMRYVASRQMWLPDDWKPSDQSELPVDKEFQHARAQHVYRQDPRSMDGELLFPQRFTVAVVRRDKLVLGEYAVAGQFQQRPAPRGGLMFKRHWFPIVPSSIALPVGTEYVRHWDLAATKVRVVGRGARTAGLLLARTPDKRYYICDVALLQDEGTEVDRLIRSTAAVDKLRYGRVEISLPQDPGQAGKVQAKNFIKELAGYVVHAEPESGDKITRAEPVQTQAEAGNIYLVEGSWVPEFLDEVAKFPTGERKDIVDAMSGAFGRLVMRAGGNVVSITAKGHR